MNIDPYDYEELERFQDELEEERLEEYQRRRKLDCRYEPEEEDEDNE